MRYSEEEYNSPKRKKLTNSERSKSDKVTGKTKGSAKGTSYTGKCK